MDLEEVGACQVEDAFLEVVLVAVRQNWRAIEFASVALRRDPEVMAAVCLECGRLEGEWRQAAAEWHAARSERDADDQPLARASVALRWRFSREPPPFCHI